MFKKKQSIMSNFYDEEYKSFVDRRFTAYNELERAIYNCFAKEAILHLFPENTDSYAQTKEALKKAKEEVWMKKIHYSVALLQEKDYYNKNHTYFVACKDYNDPNHYSVDLTIENIVRRAKGL